MGPHTDYSIALEIQDEELASFIDEVARRLQSGLGIGESEAIGDYVRPPTTSSVLNSSDLQNGSFDYFDKVKKRKIFFLKTNPQEIENTRVLREARVHEAVPYSGRLEFDDEPFFAIGHLPSRAVNLSLFKLSDRQPTEFFGTFDVLDKAASILAKIHTLGFVHKRYEVGSFVLVSNVENPLLVYRNHAMARVDSSEERERDIQSFLASLQETNPRYPHQKHNTYFIDTYKRYLKS